MVNISEKDMLEVTKKILDANGIKLSEKYYGCLTNNDYNDNAYRFLKKELIPSVYQMAVFTLNNKKKFDFKTRLVIKKVAGSYKKLTKANTSTIDKIKKTIDDGKNLVITKEKCVDVTKPIESLVKQTLEGLETLIASSTESSYLDAYNELKVTLEHTLKKLSNISDISSVKAAECSVAVFDAIIEARKCIGDNAYTSSIAVDTTKKVRKHMEEWLALNECGLKKAKEKDYKELDNSNPDEFEKITMGTQLKEKIDRLDVNLNKFNEITRTSYDVEGEQKKKDELENKLKEIKTKGKEIIAQMEANRVSKDKAQFELNRTKNEMTVTQNSIVLAQKKISYFEKQIYFRDQLADSIKEISSILKKYEVDTKLLYSLCKNIDLAEIDSLLRGTLTEEEQIQAFAHIKRVPLILKEAERRVQDSGKLINEVIDDMYNDNEFKVKAIDATNAKDIDVDELKKLFGDSEDNEEEIVEEKEEIEDKDLEELLNS